MKISINYDLLEKVKEAKLGFSLQRSVKDIIKISFKYSLFTLIIYSPSPDMREICLRAIAKYCTLFTIIGLGTNIILSKLNKKDAKEKLSKLSAMLKDIDVNTNSDLLLKSYVYKKEYKLRFNKNYIPYITQNKYIMVPTYDKGEEREISLVQEHDIGSSEYTLSHGTPKKVLKLAYNPI